MDELKIESGIPIPKKGGKWIVLGEKMKINDSVILNTKVQAYSFIAALKKLGYKGCARKSGNYHRVWKLKK